MSTEPLGSALAGEDAGPPATDAPGGTRSGVFALPAKTSFRFALLIVAVIASSAMAYEAIYTATPRGTALVALIRTCQARALASHPSGWSSYAAALGQAKACRAAAERTEGLWALLGIGVLCALAAAIYLIQPWWYERRMRLIPLTSGQASALVERLEQLREQAGIGPVTWLAQPLRFQPSAFAFGRFRRRFVAISGGAVVTWNRQPLVFDAVVLHELSHIRNRDIDQAYLAVAIWRAFVVAALVPLAALLIFSRQLGSPPALLWRVLVLALLVYLLRNSILRAREFDADARVAQLDPGTSLGTVLAGMPPRRGWRIWHLGWVHPSGQERAAALLDPAPLYRCGFWDGLAMGLVAATGAEASQSLVYLLLTANPVGGLVPGAVFALFSGAALTIAMWRMQFKQGSTARAWAVGLGLGLGMALGPVITLETAFNPGVAPDTLQIGSYVVLVIWIALVTFLFVSVPTWIGHWADAWQQREQRVPARGGMIVATIGTWIVLAIGIDLVLAYFTFVTEFTTSARVGLAQTWSIVGHYAARTTGAWLICLVFIAVPLAGYLTGRRSSRGVQEPVPGSPVSPGRYRRLALICLGGTVLVIAVLLVTAAVARVRIAPAIRWNAPYYAYYLLWDEQMVILVAVLVALIAATAIRHVLADTIAIVISAGVAAVAVLALMGSLSLGDCVASFNLTYGHPPVSGCPGHPGFVASDIFPAAIEAALIAILVIPAAHYAVILGGRQAALSRHRGRARNVLGALVAGAAVAAVIAGIALRVPDASAHGIQPIGGIGEDGWVQGTGYEIRVFPNWYDLTPAANKTNILVEYDGRFSGRAAVLTLETIRVNRGATIKVTGGRRFLLDGAAGMTSVSPDAQGYFKQVWAVIRGSYIYVLTYLTKESNGAYFEPNISAMLTSWRWSALFLRAPRRVPSGKAGVTAGGGAGAAPWRAAPTARRRTRCRSARDQAIPRTSARRAAAGRAAGA
jgi:Zn-dependent protease with chaperone function